ncbi:hypothetical protein FRC12_010950 [Ceratobasidium sp. 428]|nr:hypothetical protein FRC12_010950 [Ceratobasidium sp. 428]
MGEALSEPLLQSLYSDDPVEKILSKKDVTTITLQNLIRLLLVPTQLLLLEGSHIIPALMDLLRRHCKHNRLYDSEYGFYCVEAILFTLGIGILAESKFLKQYIDQTANLPTPRNTRGDYVTLGDCVAQFLPKDQHTGIARVFHTSTQTLAPSLGGFTTDDLCYLVDVLFQDRKQMFRAHTIADTSPGWWYAVYLMLLFNEYTLRDHGLGDKIYDIALRVELNSTWDKHDLLDKTLLMAGMTVQASGTVRVPAKAVDLQDGRLTLGRYYHYIATYGKKEARVLGLIIMWAGETAHWLNNPDLCLEYLSSHIEVLWEGVVREDSTLDRMAATAEKPASLVFLVEYFLKFAKFVLHKLAQERQRTCASMLLETGDFINLMGCILLRFTRFDLEDNTLMLATKQIVTFGNELDEFALTVSIVHNATFRRAPFVSTAIMDWTKVALYIEDALNNCTPGRYGLSHHLHAADKAWRNFQKIIPNTPTQSCSNPSCDIANPHLACMGCKHMYYCSHECQERPIKPLELSLMPCALATVWSAERESDYIV